MATTEKARSRAISHQNIPEELRDLPQWVCWQFEEDEKGKLTKVPKLAWAKQANASTTNRKTWTAFTIALSHLNHPQSLHDGIGFVFTENDPYCGIDLDDCRNPETGEIEEWAQKILDRFKSYSEVSQSGKGVHIIVKAALPGKGTKKLIPGTDHEVEMYDKGRYFGTTGQRLTEYPAEIRECQTEAEELYKLIAAEEKSESERRPAKPLPLPGMSDIPDWKIIEKATNAKNGAEFRRLMEGDWSDYPSASEADLALCGKLVFYTQDYEQILSIVQQSGLWDEKWERPDYQQRTIGKVLANIGETYDWGQSYSVTSGEQATEINKKALELTPRSFHLTDMGNGERLACHFGDDIRYCHGNKSWYLWDGKRWTMDTTGEIRQLAKRTTQKIYSEAANEPDDNQRKAIGDHARRSESSFRIRAMLEMAQSEPGIPIRQNQLDANVWLLNCQNGTVDLRTGELLPNKRGDLISKISPIEYTPGAKFEPWDQFLKTATNGDEELAAFLQRAVGYSLTGDTREEVLFFVHGPAATGKSTFAEAIKAVMGDYATTADFEVFLQRREVGTARNDVASLAGARLVASIEVDEGKRLAEGLVKILTGGDTVRARFLYQESFEFVPQLKLWLCANHAPEVSGSDTAMWRRILKLPFEHVIPEEDRDPQVKLTLKHNTQAQQAILAWAVEGCLRWQECGLGIPESVKKATREYQSEMDHIGRFINDCCVVNRNVFVLKKDLYAFYLDWCAESSEEPYHKRTFGKKLRQNRREIKDDTGTGNVYLWKGIGLKTEITTESQEG